MDPNVKAMAYHFGGGLWDYAFNRMTTGGGNPVERRIERINIQEPGSKWSDFLYHLNRPRPSHRFLIVSDTTPAAPAR